MKDEDLAKFLPRYGDRIAVVSYAKQYLADASDKKRSVQDRLISKFLGKEETSEHLRRAMPQKGNTNSRKQKRKVEIGWLQGYGIGPKKSLKQVRSPNGGGTRTDSVDVTSTMGEILQSAKDYFFPGGISRKGKRLNDFTIKIADHTQELISEDLILSEFLEETKVKQPKLYLVTYFKESENDDHKMESCDAAGSSAIHTNRPENANESVSVNEINVLHSAELQQQSDGNDSDSSNLQTVNFNDIESICKYVGIADTDVNRLTGNTDDNNSVSFQSNTSQNSSTFDSTVPIINDTVTDELLNQDVLRDINVLPLVTDDNIEVLTVRRVMIQQDMINIFKNPAITTSKIKFSFVDERGDDVEGLSRDAYTGFWESFTLRNNDGEQFRVPVLSTDYGETEWEAVGRILIKGYNDHGYFPLQLAPAFFVAVVHGENVVTPALLQDSFFGYISGIEKDVLKAALDKSDFNGDEILEIFDRFECHVLPTEENVLPSLLQVAHKVLIQEPKYSLDALRRVGIDYWQVIFPNADSVLSLYKDMEATTQRVLNLLIAEPSTKEENQSYMFFQKYIRGRNTGELKRLLRFLTGADMICVKKITITFVERYGAGRAPTAHTCGPTLELPSTYKNFPDFRTEWESILSSKTSMEMSVA